MNFKNIENLIEKVADHSADLNKIRNEIIQSLQELERLVHDKDNLLRQIAHLEYNGKITAAASLHDGPLQELNSRLQIFRSNINSKLSPDELRDESLFFSSEVSDIISQIRTILRNTLTESLKVEKDFTTTVRELIRQRSDGTSVKLNLDEDLNELIILMPPVVGNILIHFLEETMRNARIHGKADEFEISIIATNRVLRMNTCDNGCGFQSDFPVTADDFQNLADTGSLGLTMLQKMVEPLKGEISIVPKGSTLGGSSITLTIPFES